MFIPVPVCFALLLFLVLEAIQYAQNYQYPLLHQHTVGNGVTGDAAVGIYGEVRQQ